MCGLLVWTQEVNRRRSNTVVIDVMSGSSAGALTALLAARVVLAGDDPISAFHKAWVSAPSLRALRGHGSWAPLSLRAARSAAESLLFAPAAARPGPRQTTGVTLDIALSCLPLQLQNAAGCRRRGAGAVHALPRLGQAVARRAVAEAPPKDDTLARWAEALNAAIAFASHPLAFSATRLNRTAVRKAYEESGIDNLPDGPELLLWYSDGGLVENEPLGRCVDAWPATTRVRTRRGSSSWCGRP